MKASKDAVAAARRLFRLCMRDGRLNEDSLRKVIKAVAESKPRNFRGILNTLRTLVRQELARHHVTVESAYDLDADSIAKVESEIKLKHGNELTFEYKVTPALLGGMRIRKGDDVWDGSLKSRLDRLANAF
jgi:F-type H+-transporting ATPase subunit delta